MAGLAPLCIPSSATGAAVDIRVSIPLVAGGLPRLLFMYVNLASMRIGARCRQGAERRLVRLVDAAGSSRSRAAGATARTRDTPRPEVGRQLHPGKRRRPTAAQRGSSSSPGLGLIVTGQTARLALYSAQGPRGLSGSSARPPAASPGGAAPSPRVRPRRARRAACCPAGRPLPVRDQPARRLSTQNFPARSRLASEQVAYSRQRAGYLQAEYARPPVRQRQQHAEEADQRGGEAVDPLHGVWSGQLAARGAASQLSRTGAGASVDGSMVLQRSRQQAEQRRPENVHGCCGAPSTRWI